VLRVENVEGLKFCIVLVKYIEARWCVVNLQ